MAQDRDGTEIVVGDKVIVECTLTAILTGVAGSGIQLDPGPKPNGTANTKFVLDDGQVLKGTLPPP